MVDKAKQIVQGTAEWLALRVGKITGTRIQKAVGEDQFEKGSKLHQWEVLAEQMYREIVGLPRKPFNSRAIYYMDYGSKHEPDAIKTLKDDYGFKITSTPFVYHKDHDWIGMSPDGLILNGINNRPSAVEIKCPQSPHAGKVKEYKRNYWHQMQLGMECLDIEEMLYFQWDQSGNHALEWVKRDPDWAGIYIPKAQEFMDWFNEAKEKPENQEKWSVEYKEPGIHYEDIDDNDDTQVLADTLSKIKKHQEAIKQLDTVKKELSKKLIDQHKGAFRTPSVKCHLTQTRGRVNYSKLVKDQDIPFHVVEEYRAEGDSRIYTKLTEQEDDA